MFRCLVAGDRFHVEPIQVPTMVLPDVGHFLHFERPAAVADRVLAWLS